MIFITRGDATTPVLHKLCTSYAQVIHMKTCKHCQSPIPIERLAIIPNTDECVNCSSVEKVVGFMDFSHKTAGECVYVDPRNKENLRRAIRVNERAR